jgi:peptidoglycan/LPS O-acetylase OafA/YrhL
LSILKAASFRKDIQGLRAVAVILVILDHAKFDSFGGGFIGVDIFFVITGLLLRMPEKNLLENLKVFYTRRILRIVPASTLLIVVTLLAAFFLLGTNFNPQLLTDAKWSTLFSANFNLINSSSDYFIAGVDQSLLTHFWSLAVEEQFYFIYPLIIFSISYLGSNSRLRSYQLFLVGAVTTSAIWSFIYTNSNPIAAYYSPFTRFWELALGGLVAVIPVSLADKTKRINGLNSIAAFGVLIYAVATLSESSAFPGIHAWIPCAATALIIWSGTAQYGKGPATWLSAKSLTYVGDISYSLYLWHFPWLLLSARLFEVSLPQQVAAISGTFICAAISYHLFENPIRHSHRLQKDKLAVFALLLISIALVWDTSLVVEYLFLNAN